MLSLANLYRIKLSIWFRQMYMPGVRGAVAILIVNLIVIITIRIAARRMARVAAMQAKSIAKPARRRLAYATIHNK